MDWKLPRSSQQSAWPPSVSGAFSSLIRRELALRVDFALAFHYKTCILTGRLLDFVLNLLNFRLYWQLARCDNIFNHMSVAWNIHNSRTDLMTFCFAFIYEEFMPWWWQRLRKVYSYLLILSHRLVVCRCKSNLSILVLQGIFFSLHVCLCWKSII